MAPNSKNPIQQFYTDSVQFLNACKRPDAVEYKQIAMATVVGFAVMGFIGFFVKLVHIPINNMIVSS
eukprot:m.246281 g.246281  ORF g.246281 m.246281 type:complete len:67 (+) comp15376_c0_seq2:407-607(+)